MVRDSRKKAWVAIAKLFGRIVKKMPLHSIIWIGIPLALGGVIIPALAAQGELVDLFLAPGDDGAAGKAWPAKAVSAYLPLTVILLTGVLSKCLNAVHNVIDVRLRDRSSRLIQAEVQELAMRAPLDRLDQPDYYDRLQRAQEAAGTELMGVLQQTIFFIRLSFEAIGAIAVVALVHPLLGCLLGFVFLLSFGIRLESDLVKRRLNRDLTRSGRQSDYLQETIVKPETVRDMRISGSLGYLIDRWSDIMSQSLTLRGNANRREIRRGILVSSLQIAGLIGAIVWILLRMKAGELTPGTLLIVFQAMRQVYGLSMRMSFPAGKLYIQSAKLVDLADFLSDFPKENRELEIGQRPGTTGLIQIEDVTYRYHGAKEPVLAGVSMTLEPGETVALVGENGAGKSTLVKLLLGLYAPSEGRVLWDGADYRALDPTLLRRQMSAAFQDFVRYESTLRDNVGFGLPDEEVPDATIRGALQASGADGLARLLPDGLDARLGLLAAGGRELSGGQWQRLAIARAALRDARLLVLDEPTSALDPQHETELFRSFRALAAGRTAVFVSHRLGWARHADRIVVLRQGRIVEEGSHRALMALDGEYASMFRAQAEWYGRGGMDGGTNGGPWNSKPI